MIPSVRNSQEGQRERLSESFEYFPIGVIILDDSGRVVEMNRMQETISKIKREKEVKDITKALSTWKVEDKTEFFRAKLRSMSINDSHRSAHAL